MKKVMEDITIIRNNKNKSTNNSYKSNKSQLILGKSSKRSQPKSGNDSNSTIKHSLK